MNLHVLSTIDRRFKGFVTIRAHERPLVAVSNQVSLHTTLGREFCTANRATVRSRLLVRVQMRFEYAVGRESPENILETSIVNNHSLS